MAESERALMANTRASLALATKKSEEAAAMGDRIGGQEGAAPRAKADYLRTNSLMRVGDLAAAARAACSSLRAARKSGSQKHLVEALLACGTVEAPGEMVKAERESREIKRRSGSPHHGGLVLSQAGQISLATSAAALSRLDVAYNEAAVDLCDAALAAADGHDSPDDDDFRFPTRAPGLLVQAEARACLALCLYHHEDPGTRCVELQQEAVALLRKLVRAEAPGRDPNSGAAIAKLALARKLINLAAMVNRQRRGLEAEAVACLREALVLSEGTDDVQLKQTVLGSLVNMSGQFEPAETEDFLFQLNQLSVKTGRSTETTCTICLEPLDQPGGSVDAVDAETDSVIVLQCGHQFHRSCGLTWWMTQRGTGFAPLTAAERPCPVCKQC